MSFDDALFAANSERTHVVTGLWKFNQGIEIVNQLVALAREWSSGPDSAKYLTLYVRRCSKDQYGIGFSYDYASDPHPTGEETSHKWFFRRMTDQLKRRFGNDFVGWDLSSPTWIIK